MGLLPENPSAGLKNIVQLLLLGEKNYHLERFSVCTRGRFFHIFRKEL